MDKDLLVSKIGETAELLYQQKVEEGYQSLHQILPEIAVCADQMETMEDKVNLLSTLQEALKAMEEKDTTLLADILQYEVVDKISIA